MLPHLTQIEHSPLAILVLVIPGDRVGLGSPHDLRVDEPHSPDQDSGGQGHLGRQSK